MNRTFVSLGAGFAFLAVALGAFGAHALKDRLDAPSKEIWQTAAHYHLIHAVALVLVGMLAGSNDSKFLRWSGRLFAAGIVLFAGSLYALALSGVKILGAITPLGGLCFLAAWLLICVAFARPATGRV